MKLLLALLLGLPVLAQSPFQIHFVVSDPTGTCPSGGSYFIAQNIVTGTLSGCINGTWGPIVSGSPSLTFTPPLLLSGTTVSISPTPNFTSVTTGDGTIPGQYDICQTVLNGAHCATWAIDDATLSDTVQYRFPDAAPPAIGASMVFTAPVTGVTKARWGNPVVLFGALPACNSGTEGFSRPISDSTTATWGATITGTGSNHVLAYCNGTNWTVAAK